MDPQLEEYRRKQKERAASVAAQEQSGGRMSFLALGGMACVVAAALFYQAGSAATLGEQSQTPQQSLLQTASNGVCPTPAGVGACVEECSSHTDCKAGKLCCSNGCGHVCMSPQDPSKANRQKTRPCTLMAVVEQKHRDALADVEESILLSVPAPKKSNMLRSSGILILDYAAEAQCCTASHLLHGNAAISSVEFDGPEPDCSGGSELLQDVSIPGGVSGETDVTSEQLAIWKQVLESNSAYDGTDLVSLGDPVSVKTQVVAGTNYDFKFAGGEVVRVFHQPWTNTLEVTAVTASG